MERNCEDHEEHSFPNFEFGSRSKIVYWECPTKNMDVKYPRELCEIQEYLFIKKLEIPLTSKNEEISIYQEEIKLVQKVKFSGNIHNNIKSIMNT